MTNMAYCRFRNTLGDLQDCHDYLDDVPEEAEEEQAARRYLIRLCGEIYEAGEHYLLRRSS